MLRAELERMKSINMKIIRELAVYRVAFDHIVEAIADTTVTIGQEGLDD